jgi:polyphosphate kinase
MNSLVDKEMIEELYEASKAGVRIRLIIRGVCSLIPGVKGLSENIEAISIVDKFLEHSRIFIFCNGGKERYYIASGDWMNRNLDFRSEVAVPIYDPLLQSQLLEYVMIQFRDNTKARLHSQGNKNEYVKRDGKAYKAQDEIYKWIAGYGQKSEVVNRSVNEKVSLK